MTLALHGFSLQQKSFVESGKAQHRKYHTRLELKITIAMAAPVQQKAL